MFAAEFTTKLPLPFIAVIEIFPLDAVSVIPPEPDTIRISPPTLPDNNDIPPLLLSAIILTASALFIPDRKSKIPVNEFTLTFPPVLMNCAVSPTCIIAVLPPVTVNGPLLVSICVPQDV